jgi:pimeloyl-ACP methyl ester carboxylesterase
MAAASLATSWALAGEAAEPKRSEQYGATRLDFPVPGGRGFVLLPTSRAPDGPRPWLWYAPTIGGYPNASNAWLLTRLLDKGFAVAGVDVGESFGSPRGTQAFDAFYRHVVKEYGLSPRACLLPQSRGGLMLYNWAATGDNAARVQCIGGIYPVCDLRSYPGLARASPAYGMTEQELRQRLAEHNPLDRLAPLATAGVPILHLHGDADKVVPLEANSAELARRYQALGGKMELLVVPGQGHAEIPAYFQSQPLLDFFLSHGLRSGKPGGSEQER